MGAVGSGAGVAGGVEAGREELVLAGRVGIRVPAGDSRPAVTRVGSSSKRARVPARRTAIEPRFWLGAGEVVGDQRFDPLRIGGVLGGGESDPGWVFVDPDRRRLGRRRRVAVGEVAGGVAGEGVDRVGAAAAHPGRRRVACRHSRSASSTEIPGERTGRARRRHARQRVPARGR